jgi:hypothetical protein
MTAECRIIDPSVLPLLSMAFEGRIYCLLMKWDVSWRRGTHTTQNTRHDVVIMREFCLYVKFKASLLGIDCRALFNADETNVNFQWKVNILTLGEVPGRSQLRGLHQQVGVR